MRSNQMFVVLFAVMLIVFPRVVLSAPIATPTNELMRLQSILSSEVARIDAKYMALQTNGPTQYLQQLELLEKTYQQNGEFKSVMAVREEQKQFSRESLVPRTDSDTDPKELKDLKAKTRLLASRREEQKLEELTTIGSAYARRLETLQKEMTKQGQIDSAADVQVEIDRIKKVCGTTVPEAGAVGRDASLVAGSENAKAAFPTRTPAGRKSAMSAFGGSSAGEDSVLRALRWFKANQDANGSWSTADRTDPTAMAGLVLLCFLARNETSDSAEFGQTVTKVIEYIVSKQSRDGSFGREYTHGMCTHAISEAFALTKNMALKEAVEKAIAVIVRGQQTTGGFDYGYAKHDRWDLSVAGWQFQALNAAKMAGVGDEKLDSAIKLGAQFLRQQAFAPGPGGFGYSGKPGAPGTSASPSMTGDGTFCLQLLGYPNVPEVRAGLSYMKDMPCVWSGYGMKAAKVDGLAQKKRATVQDAGTGKNSVYAWYYITYATFLAGGVNWRAWNSQLSRALISGQEEDGHWDYGDHGGPVYTTSMCCLMLEVYYRYPRASAQGAWR